MTSGLRSSAETGDLPLKRRRTSAIDARIPSSTAPTLEIDAMIALVANAAFRSGLVRKWRYQCRVKPLSGNDGSCESLKEKITRITIGAYRNATTRTKKTLSPQAPVLESAPSISPPSPAAVGGSARRSL